MDALNIKNMLFIKDILLNIRVGCCLLIVFFGGCKFDETNKDREIQEKELLEATDKLEKSVGSNTAYDYDSTDSETLKSGFEYIGPKGQGLTVVGSNGKYGYINNKQELVIDLQFDDAQPFSEGLAPVKKNEKWGYINLDGHFKIQPYLDIATPFKVGLAAVRKDFLWGYINKSNQTIIPFEYDFAYPFDNKKAQVMKGTSWFYINKTGEPL
jgi:hypothetical protein